MLTRFLAAALAPLGRNAARTRCVCKPLYRAPKDHKDPARFSHGFFADVKAVKTYAGAWMRASSKAPITGNTCTVQSTRRGYPWRSTERSMLFRLWQEATFLPRGAAPIARRSCGPDDAVQLVRLGLRACCRDTVGWRGLLWVALPQRRTPCTNKEELIF